MKKWRELYMQEINVCGKDIKIRVIISFRRR